MQTFLAYPDYKLSASVLDMKRLGKQRVEAWQIVQALTVPEYGWKNHPAVKMWRGHVPALIEYGIAICEEWRSRGYKDTMLPRFLGIRDLNNAIAPYWLGDASFHASHRSKLLFKNFDWYSKNGWAEAPGEPGLATVLGLEYVWPSVKD